MLVDACTAMDHPRLFLELFEHSFCDAGGCTLQDRCWRALKLQINSLSCRAQLVKGGFAWAAPERFLDRSFCVRLNVVLSKNLIPKKKEHKFAFFFARFFFLSVRPS